jgi:hypothetical protein
MKASFSRALAVFAVFLSMVAAADDSGFQLFPLASTNLVGDTFSFALVSPDGQQPYGFQWQKDGTNIDGATQPAITIFDAQLSDDGVYSLAFSVDTDTNTLQLTLSAPAYVIAVPQIYEPVRMSSVGSSVTFSVDATGGLLSYQWTWQGYDILGATRSTLTFADGYANASAGYYAVRVSNPLGTNSSSPTSLLFTKPTPAGSYQGIFFAPDAAALESTGFFQYTISSSKRSFSGKLTLGTARYRFSGLFSDAHVADSSIVLLSGDGLRTQMQLVTTNNAPIVFGSVSSGSWQAALSGQRLYFSSKNPTTLAGKYTLVLQNTNTTAGMPNGHGYGTVVVKKDGTLAFSGRTADGTTISQSCGLSRFGEWPLYAAMNKQQGRVVGWLKMQKQSASSIQGTNVFWMKGPTSEKLYPGGFKLALQPLGSTYLSPTNKTVPVLSWTNGIANLYGGDMFSGDTAMFSFTRCYLRPRSTLIAEKGVENLNLKISLGAGTIEGAFTDAIAGKRVPIRGVLLQQQKCARGFFLAPSDAGAFSLAPTTASQ